MRMPSSRIYTEVCQQWRPTLGKGARGGTTLTPPARVQPEGEPAEGFVCSFKYTGVQEREVGGGVQQVQVYSLNCPARDLRQGDLIQCPAKWPGLYFKVESIGRPGGGGVSGTGGFITAECTAFQAAATQAQG